MQLELHWRPSVLGTCIYTARRMSRGDAVIDPSLGDVLTAPVAALAKAIDNSGIPSEALWSHIAALAISPQSPRQLVETAIRKTVGAGGASEKVAAEISRSIGDLERTVQRAYPNLRDELEVRGEPLKQQWSARGVGLMKRIAALTHEVVLASRVEVALAAPVFGGGGAAHIWYNAVTIEAILANPSDRLPEVVRLAWLISQLNLELPIISEEINAERLPRVAAVAMLPVALAAAEYVELASFDDATLQLAIDMWRLRESGVDAATIMTWWNTYQEGGDLFVTALNALDYML